MRAIERTTRWFEDVIKDFPVHRWRESPGGEANDFRGVMIHLINSIDWFLRNLAVPEEIRPAPPNPEACQSGQELVEMFRTARAKQLDVLRSLPEEQFDQPSPECKYPFNSGAELILYSAEHDFWHIGQIQMLKMALSPQGEGAREG